jgi:hypothetical protein
MKLEFVKNANKQVTFQLIEALENFKIFLRSDFYYVFIIELGCIDRIFESKVGKKITNKSNSNLAFNSCPCPF